MTVPAQASIGFFDSGVGGLTVARACVDRLPHEAILYMGDTARVPYGNKSPLTIQRYSRNIVRHLLESHVKAVVIACNTASAHAVENLRATFDVPILDVIDPVSKLACATTKTGEIGVVGTRGTVASQAYPRALRAHGGPDMRVVSQPCPLFVPLVEEGWVQGSVPCEVARTYLEPFRHTRIDTLILGCTHYPLLRSTIEPILAEIVGHPVRILDSATATAEMLHATLQSQELLRSPSALSRNPSHRFQMTDASPLFRETCTRFFGAPVHHIEHVDLKIAPLDEPPP